MSTIRRQSILSSFIVYFGFALGFFNTYLFTREGGFTREEYGLTGTFIAFANIMYAVAGLGMPGSQILIKYFGKVFPAFAGDVIFHQLCSYGLTVKIPV